MTSTRVLCLLGGVYHDFDQVEVHLRELLPQVGIGPRFTRNPVALGSISHADTDLAFIYSCSTDKLDEAAVENLISFVESGGGLFAMHGATASFPDNPEVLSLIGARFREHGPRHNFLVTPMERSHPVTDGIEAFTVNDELYVQEYAADLQIHMVAAYLGKMQPVVWTHTPGSGRVCYLALGHDLAVWQHPSVQQLIVNGILWSSRRL